MATHANEHNTNTSITNPLGTNASNTNEYAAILCYTRLPQEELIYAPKLAYSMHLAISENGQSYRPLNHNSGVFFAKATDNEDGTLRAKSLKSPFLFELADGGYGVVVVRTESEGEEDEQSKGSVLVAVTEDLLQYEEVGLIHLKGDCYVRDVTCRYCDDRKSYVIHWSDDAGNYYENTITNLRELTASEPVSAKPFVWNGFEIAAPDTAQALNDSGQAHINSAQALNDTAQAHNDTAQARIDSAHADIEGLQARNSISVSKAVADRLVRKLTTPQHIGTEGPEAVAVSSPEETRRLQAKAIYSDGTQYARPVDWDLEGVDWTGGGTRDLKGKLRQTTFAFPFASHRADPNIAKWNGKYYFIATNDADGQKTFSVREASSLAGLGDAEEVQILDSGTYEHVGGLLWAPEFHIIKNNLYIFHAATPKEFFQVEAHVMKLREGGNPLNGADWSEPKRVVRPDGSYLCEAGKTISLDMTVIHWNGDIYAAWSERQFLPVDLGAWIYIAKLDINEPWKLASDSVVISKPDYGWANNRTFVDEGPFPLYGENKLFLTFSSAATDASYCVGLLSIDNGADLLNPANWTKGNYPILTSRNVPGEYGPGHNSYVTDDDGLVWNVYHAKAGLDEPRCSGLRRVHFDADGYPVLDLTDEKDVNPDFAEVTATITILAK